MDIAIIGLSLKCANISTLEQYIELLRNCGVRTIQPTEERIVNSKLLRKESYHPYGFLDRVDLFDHEFFNLSKAEANTIDPNHRMILEVICAAVENSGYNLEEQTFRSTGLFTSFPATAYNVLYQSENKGLDFVGGIPSIGGGRVANILNIRGPVMNIDTACSSSLVAVHEALQYLKRGEIEKAIVAGSHIRFMFSEANSLANDPIMAADGICRAFDDLASGTSGGEGVAAIILKPLEQAIRDQDNIMGVIKGSAINNDGNRSSSVTAPSPVAQKEVILTACKNAGIPIASVGYIETHGTGTKLGDPIEYKGIKDAFSSQTEPYAVRLGSLKPNIGHLDNMAGLFGLLKAVAVLKEKEFFPLANFTNANRFIEQEQHVVLQKEGNPWTSATSRRAGVSSFGLSGTNAHVILEEYVPKEKQNLKTNNKDNWFKIAAKSKKALKQYIDNIHQFVSETTNIGDLAYTLNNGRADYKYRLAVSGDNIEQLKKSLLVQREKCDDIDTTKYNKIALLYLSDDLGNIENALGCAAFNGIFRTKEKEMESGTIKPAVAQTLAFQTTLFQYLSEKGFAIDQLICNGNAAKVSKALIEGKSSIPVDLDFEEKAQLDFERLKVLAKNCNENNILLLLAGKGTLVQNILATLEEERIPATDVVQLLSDKNWSALWTTLYNNGLSFDWNKFYQNESFSKVAAPTYPFEKISCWNEIENPLVFQSTENKASNPEIKSLSENRNEEEVVMDILKEVLQNFEIKGTDDFFELGGNSIVGIQFINRINELFAIKIIFDDLFECYEINDIIALVKKEILKKENIAAAPKEEHAVTIDRFEASNSQKRMWVESQFDGSFYNIDLTYSVNGPVDTTVFKETLVELIKKHASLRSFFFLDENGTIQQIAGDTNAINIDDFFVLESETEVSAVEIKKEEAKKFRFDLEKGPLFKATLLQSDQDKYKLIFVFHHIIFDGWSVGIFVKDFVTIYQQILNKNYTPEYNKSDYLEYLGWLKESLAPEKMESCQLYWQNKLKDINSNLQLGNPNAETDKGAKIKYVINEQLRNKLNDLAGKNRTTLFVVLMASVRAFLYRVSQENFVIGTPISGRVKKEFESTIGMFINTLPIYAEVDHDKSFTACLSEEKASINKALEYQIYPYDMILNDLKVVNKQAFFDVLVVLQNQDNRAGLLRKGDLPFDIVMDTNLAEQLSRFNMTFTFYEAPDYIEMELEYKTAVFGAAFMDSLLDSYFYSLEQFIALPEEKISQHSMLNDKQHNQIVNEFNELKKDYPADKTMIDLFEAQVEKTPDHIAVVFEDNELTYRELNTLANQLGHYLREKYTIKPEDLIGIRLDRSEKMVVAVLGILKSGAAYVPIDPNYPQERIEYIEKDSDAKAVLDENSLSLFFQHKNEYSNVNPEKINQSHDLAYVIYTSGTTGNPKGVMVEHFSVVSIAENWRKHYELDRFEVNLLQLASISFDVFVGDVCRSLLTGGKMIVCSNDIKLNPEQLFEVMEAQKVSILEGTPALLLPLMEFIKREDKDCSFLKLLIFGSDSFNNKDYNDLKDRYGNTMKIINSYGVTEATIDSTYYDDYKTELNGVTPIGKPFSNTEIKILDGYQNLVPQGVIGEIVIGGDGLARGYFKRDDLTAEKFVTDPFDANKRIYKTGDLGRWLSDGTIEYLGRKDNQVKIRGHRIELGEIENTILQFSPILKQVVAEVRTNKGEKVLVAYLVAEAEVDKSALRAFLLDKLPDFMIPGFYRILDVLPLTPNGKVNRKALPEISEEDIVKKEYIAPRNETEEKLVAIWQEVLGIDTIGMADDFFELGGHSLNATKLISIIHRQFDIKLSIVDLFDYTTLENLALLLENTIAYSTCEKADVSVEESENFTL